MIPRRRRWCEISTSCRGNARTAAVLAPIYNDWIDRSTISVPGCKWNEENNGLEALLYSITLLVSLTHRRFLAPLSLSLSLSLSHFRRIVSFHIFRRSRRTSENLHVPSIARLIHFRSRMYVNCKTRRWLRYEIATKDKNTACLKFNWIFEIHLK